MQTLKQGLSPACLMWENILNILTAVCLDSALNRHSICPSFQSSTFLNISSTHLIFFKKKWPPIRINKDIIKNFLYIHLVMVEFVGL
ncbi:hypothetical protein [Undibacterium sp. KW1]|uniref:hypothetical protein n=1 Tax=Undibacterium sp. KW1 TaxID=2058624 RepID=UPI001389A80A|nr:hypothetical protein [Undibacterium sp. KW1]